MNAIACGLMFTGLLLGALSGSILLALIVISIGLLCALYEYIKERQEEKRENAWRKNYPIYRY